MATPIAAFDAQVVIDGIELMATKWTVAHKVDQQPTTHLDSNGYTDKVVDCQEASVQVEGLANLDGDDAYLFFNVGDVVDLEVYYATEQIAYSFSAARVTSFTLEADVRGLIRFTVDFDSLGSFTPSYLPSYPAF